MGRMIDADRLKREFPKDTDWEYPVNTNEHVCEVIDAQPTVPQWIPCSERLPEESDDYLCSYGALTGHFVGIDIYEADKKEFGFYSDDEQGNEVWHPVKNVIAWMPLPQPWKGGEEDE